MKILLVDDDHDLIYMLRYAFQREGYEVLTALDGEAALRVFRAGFPNLLVLDLHMPKRSGFEVLQEIRRESKVPVIILTGIEDEDRIVSVFENGADDYLAKPFRPRELKARVKALLRRSLEWQNHGERAIRPLSVGDISLDAKTMQVRVSGRLVKLTRTEFALLQYLMVNCDRMLTASDIIADIWGFDAEQSDDALRVNISRLRRKIEPNPSNPTYLINVPGIGYRFLYNPTEA